MPSGKKHHKISTFSLAGNPFSFWFDVFLVVLSAFALGADLFRVSIGYMDEVLLASVAFIGLVPVAISAFRALASRRLTVDLLASIALVFSLLSSEFHSAVFISLMLASARFFAYFTEKRTQKAIQGLLKLRPSEVHLKLSSGEIVQKPLEEVRVGDLAVVESGERIAVDGTVEEGSADVDQSSLTGESMPVAKKAGDEVWSSTLNVSGSLLVRVKKIGADTTFAKILKLIDESQKGKAPVVSITEKFTNYYIFLTLSGGIMVFYLTGNLALVLSLLLVTCADDIAIAIPLAFIGAIGTAAKRGIIIKGASFIEALTRTKIMVFDKTGTLTQGKPEVKNAAAFSGFSENKFLGILGGILSESGHPTARAAARFIRGKNIKFSAIEEIHEEPGYGILGVLGGEKVFAGKENFLENSGIVFSQSEKSAIQKEKALGRMLVVLGIGRRSAGFVSLSDSVRRPAAEVIAEIKKMGVERVIMLTGDNETVAGQVAKETGITEFRANLLPENKVSFMRSVLSKDYKVAMLGDGINDAASLALADVGFAMGAIGSDTAIEAADIALMKDDLMGVADSIKMSKKTMAVVRQNLLMWGIINFTGLILVFGGILGPAGAAAYNFLTDFFPPLNSLKLFEFRRRN